MPSHHHDGHYQASHVAQNYDLMDEEFDSDEFGEGGDFVGDYMMHDSPSKCKKGSSSLMLTVY